MDGEFIQKSASKKAKPSSHLTIASKPMIKVTKKIHLAWRGKIHSNRAKLTKKQANICLMKSEGTIKQSNKKV